MHAFILLGLAVSSALAAVNSNGELINLAGLQKRNLGVINPNQLFGRQAGTCPALSTPCSDGISCCEILETCCLDGCCQSLYTCDPTGDGTASQPCVCYGIGCPDPENGGSSTTFSRPFSSTTPSRPSATNIPSSTEDDDNIVTVTATPTAAATNDSSEDSSANETSNTGPIATVTVSGGGSSGGGLTSGGGDASGDSDGAGVQLSSLGALAVMMMAGSVGIVAMIL